MNTKPTTIVLYASLALVAALFAGCTSSGPKHQSFKIIQAYNGPRRPTDQVSILTNLPEDGSVWIVKVDDFEL